MTRQSQLIEGAIDVIQKLSQKYKLYLITNASVAVQRKRLAQTPFDNYFEKYYISEEVGFHKPQKAFFDAVIDSIGDADRKNYLVIGDSLSSDIKGASDSALDSCYYDPEYKGYSDVVPTYTVHRLCELLTLL